MTVSKDRQKQDELRVQAGIGSPLCAAFDAARGAGILLSVLRNYERLPDAPGRDMDVYVEASQARAAADLFIDAFSSEGWFVISDWDRSAVRSISLAKPLDKDVAGFTIDLVSKITWRAIEIVDAGQIVLFTLRDSRFPHLTGGFDAALRFQKAIYRGEEHTLNQFEKVRALARKDPDGFISAISYGLTKCDTDKIISAVLGPIHSDGQEIDFVRIRRRVMVRNLLKQPGIIGSWLQTIFRLLIVPRGRRGQLIVFVGPDGSGKSTTIGQVETYLQNHATRKVSVHYGRVKIFPRLGSLVKLVSRKKSGAVDFTKKHSGSGVAPHPGWRVLIYFIYYGLEGFLSRFFIAIRKLRGEVLLFDRFAYDFAAQPAYSNVPRRWLKTLLSLLPTPDSVIYLRCNAEEIYARKPELKLPDIKKQQQAYSELLSELKVNVVEVETSKSAEASGFGVVQAVASQWFVLPIVEPQGSALDVPEIVIS